MSYVELNFSKSAGALNVDLIVIALVWGALGC